MIHYYLIIRYDNYSIATWNIKNYDNKKNLLRHKKFSITSVSMTLLILSWKRVDRDKSPGRKCSAAVTVLVIVRYEFWSYGGQCIVHLVNEYFLRVQHMQRADEPKDCYLLHAVESVRSSLRQRPARERLRLKVWFRFCSLFILSKRTFEKMLV